MNFGNFLQAGVEKPSKGRPRLTSWQKFFRRDSREYRRDLIWRQAFFVEPIIHELVCYSPRHRPNANVKEVSKPRSSIVIAQSQKDFCVFYEVDCSSVDGNASVFDLALQDQ